MGVLEVWSELKGLGLDMTFLLDTLIEKNAPATPEIKSLEETRV